MCEIVDGVEDTCRRLLNGASSDDLEGFVNTIETIRANFQSMQEDG